VSSFLRKDKGASRTGRKLWQSATMFIYSPIPVEAIQKICFCVGVCSTNSAITDFPTKHTAKATFH